MKNIFTALFIFFPLIALCQSGIDDKDSSDNYFISKMRNFILQNERLNVSNEEQNKNLYNEVATFVRQHPKRELSFLFISWTNNLKVELLLELVKLVDTSLNKSPYKAYTDYALTRMKITETGKHFPELMLTDTLGIKTSLASFRGKVILLDFWSSWCGPCRQQTPELRSLYKKYSKKGFEIIGISMDEDKQKWLDAISKDKVTWINFCEFVSWRNNKISNRFAIKSIPSNFLIDRNGILIGQDLSMEKLKLELVKQL